MSIYFIINNIVGGIFTLIYLYQMYFIWVAITRKPKPFADAPARRHAIMICARNESSVIGHLIESIQSQNYPKELIDIWVIADNCDDNTAEIARAKGAFVVERHNKEKVGKGYALHYLLTEITQNWTRYDYEGYFVIDADNLLDKNFMMEMNKALAAGNRIVTAYRNSKNYGDNWISSGYALWFMRESKYLNNSRQILGLSSQCSGTGFAIHKDVFIKHGEWNYFTLTEDVEFTFAMVAAGERIAFCADAVLYDEQPVKFGISWKQRTRWVKGYFQAYYRYGGKLLEGVFRRRDFSCYDMLANTFSGAILSVSLFVLYFVVIAFYAITGRPLSEVLIWFAVYVGSCCLGLIIIGSITTSTEWEQIYCPKAKKIAYIFSFPLFLLALLPIVLCVPFSREHWSQIHHVRAVDLDEVKNSV